MIIFQFLNLTIFLSMELLIRYFKIFPLEMGGHMGKITYVMGALANDGDRGQIFAIFVRTYKLKDLIYEPL